MTSKLYCTLGKTREFISEVFERPTDSNGTLLGEAIWVASGQIASAIAVLIGVRLITEFVPKQVYGTVTLLIGLITLANHVFVNPLNQAGQRFYADAVLTGSVAGLRRAITKTLKRVVGGLIAAILLGGAVCMEFLQVSYVVIVTMAGLMSVEAARNLELSLLTAARRQKEYALWQALESFARPIVVVLVVVFAGATSKSVLLGYLVASGSILLMFYGLPTSPEGLNRSQENLRLSPKLLYDMRSFALPLVPAALVGWVNNLSDRYVLASLLGVGQVGIYAATYGLISRAFLTVGSIISQTLRPLYFKAISTRDRDEEKRILGRWLLSVILTCVFGVVIIFCLKYWIAGLLLAEEYRDGASVMTWIAIGVSLQTIGQIYDQVLFGHKKTRLLLLSQSVGACVCVASVFILTSRFGLVGTAAACPIYFFVMLMMKMLLVFKTDRTKDCLQPGRGENCERNQLEYSRRIAAPTETFHG